MSLTESTAKPHLHTARDHALLQWLSDLDQSLALDIATLRAASSDASFRRYFRLNAAQKTLIVMDAPPPQENCQPFIDVTQRLQAASVTVPEILANDVTQGFLLLTDLGQHTYYDKIVEGWPDQTRQSHYLLALDALVKLQQANGRGLAALDRQRLIDELQLFPDWFVQKHHGVTLTDQENTQLTLIFATLANEIANQPQVLVHRDFHSPNLMVCDDPAMGSSPGVLDYQDALLGPISYDIASLVFDARTTWEEPQQLDWAIRYWERARAAGLPVDPDFAVFYQQYEWAGLQRNLRILGVFARLNLRDHKPGYLNHLPRVLQYVRQVSTRYGVFRPLIRLLDRLEGIEPQTKLTF
jgi:N-acetylmuramate 1-kinase